MAATVVDCSPYYSGHADQAGLLDFLLTQNARKNQVYESVRRVFLNHGENESRSALRAQILQTQGSIGKRSVEAVECPAADSGWFDLVENRWVEGFDPGIDDSSFQIACLQSRLERIEAILAKAGLGGLPDALRPELNGWKDVSKIDLLKPEQAIPALERDCARRSKA